MKTFGSEFVWPNKQSALISLNTTPITEGDLLRVKYSIGEKSEGLLFAIGIKDGIGPDCYSLISDLPNILVTDIVDTVPDPSEMVFGQIYIVRNPWRRVQLSSDGSILSEDLSDSFYFSNLADNRQYYWNSEKVVNISENLVIRDNFFVVVTQEEYERMNPEDMSGKVLFITDGSKIVDIIYDSLGLGKSITLTFLDTEGGVYSIDVRESSSPKSKYYSGGWEIGSWDL